MATPMYEDKPLALLPTPKFQTGSEDPFTREASNMALSHNAFIRGFNSIYQQAPRVSTPEDKAQFVLYSIAWVDCVDTHHKYEESEFFPNFNQAAGEEGLMDDAVHQHETFSGGLHKMKEYLVGCTGVDDGAGFDSAKLLAIMEEFKDPLYEHLAAEPVAILGLAKYSTEEKPIDVLGIARAAGMKQVNPDFQKNTLPVFFLNMEVHDFEGGMWNEIMPPKGVTPGLMGMLCPDGDLKQWRFASCGTDGHAKPLAV